MQKLYFPSKKELDPENNTIIDSYDYLANAASATDCTGLIPSYPVSEAELDSYNELYQYEPPKLRNTQAADSGHVTEPYTE